MLTGGNTMKPTCTFISLLGLAMLAAVPAARADSDTVTYVDSVSCTAGVCEARHKTEPVERTLRERYSGGVCVEYTRRITGMKKVPTTDPLVSIEVPQYQVGESRHLRCDQAAVVKTAGG
jgi:hypothetical protein